MVHGCEKSNLLNMVSCSQRRVHRIRDIPNRPAVKSREEGIDASPPAPPSRSHVLGRVHTLHVHVRVPMFHIFFSPLIECVRTAERSSDRFMRTYYVSTTTTLRTNDSGITNQQLPLAIQSQMLRTHNCPVCVPAAAAATIILASTS